MNEGTSRATAVAVVTMTGAVVSVVVVLVSTFVFSLATALDSGRPQAKPPSVMASRQPTNAMAQALREKNKDDIDNPGFLTPLY
jgi:hypothetical protein